MNCSRSYAISLMFLLAPLLQSQGLTTEWEIRKTLDSVIAQSDRLKPLLDEVRVAEWAASEARASYSEQVRSLRAELGYLRQNASELGRQPDRLTKALEVFLRLNAIESMMISIANGVRSHQNPALAELMEGVLSENSASRGQLREYLVELTAAKEFELSAADQEAQRCRGSIISGRPATKPAKVVPKAQ